MKTRACSTTLDPEMSDIELAAMDEWIRNASLKGRHLEIGTAAGGSLCHLMNQYEAEQRPPFSVVDTMSYFPDQLETVQSNLVGNGLRPDDVDFRVKSSSDAYKSAVSSDERFDFILIDASHKIRHVMDDLRWLRLLNVGGVACVHDYAPKFPGVRWAVDRFLHKNSHFEKLGLAGTLIGISRTKDSPRAVVTEMDRLWALSLSPVIQLNKSLRKRLTKAKKV